MLAKGLLNMAFIMLRYVPSISTFWRVFFFYHKWVLNFVRTFFCIYWSLGSPGGSDGKESACNAGDTDLIPGLGRFPGEGNDNPLQYSCLENPMDRGAKWATVHEVSKSQTQLSNFHQGVKQLMGNSPWYRISHTADLPGLVLNPLKDPGNHLGWMGLISPAKTVITDPNPSFSLSCPPTWLSIQHKIRLVFPR